MFGERAGVANFSSRYLISVEYSMGIASIHVGKHIVYFFKQLCLSIEAVYGFFYPDFAFA